jgi:hypothetical protein
MGLFMTRFSASSAPLLIALLMTCLSGPALSQDKDQDATDWKQGAWGKLAPYIGTYKYDDVLNDPDVSKKLDAALGTEKKHLIDNLAVREPIGFDNDCLVLSGNAEKQATFEKAYLNVCLFAGTINVALFSDGKITVYSAMKDYQYLPETLQQWVYLAKNPDAFSVKPDNVQLMTLPE